MGEKYTNVVSPITFSCDLLNKNKKQTNHSNMTLVFNCGVDKRNAGMIIPTQYSTLNIRLLNIF